MVSRVSVTDLLDASEVADLLGLSSPKAVAVYRKRHDDFPEPIVIKASGKCVLWLRGDVEAWIDRRRP